MNSGDQHRICYTRCYNMGMAGYTCDECGGKPDRLDSWYDECPGNRFCSVACAVRWLLRREGQRS